MRTLGRFPLVIKTAAHALKTRMEGGPPFLRQSSLPKGQPCVCGHSKAIHNLNSRVRAPNRKYPCNRLNCRCKDYRPAKKRNRAALKDALQLRYNAAQRLLS